MAGRRWTALALAAALAGAATASASGPPPLLVGPGTLLSTTTVDGCPGPAGLTAAEPVADGAGATVTWQQGQDNRRLGRAVRAASVVDGDLLRRPPVGHDACTGGAPTAVQFPDLSAGPEGVRWVASVGRQPGGALGTSAVRVSRSLDAGRTWSAPAVLTTQDTERLDGLEPELAWVVGSPRDPDAALALWAAFRGQQTPVNHAAQGALLASRTTDGGRTWTAPSTVLSATAAQGAPLQVQAQVLGDGSIGAAVTLAALGSVVVQEPRAPVVPSPRRIPVVFLRSTDGGATWSAPSPVLEVDGFAVQDPKTRAQLRFMPHPGLVQTGSGDLLVAAEDDPGTRDGRVALARSRDLGRTWTPEPAVRTAAGQVLHPTLARDGRGRLLAAWYELSSPDEPGPTSLTHLAALSRDGGATWSAPTTVAGPAPLDALAVPYVAGVPSVSADGNAFAAVSVLPPAGATPAARGTEAVLRRLQPTG